MTVGNVDDGGETKPSMALQAWRVLQTLRGPLSLASSIVGVLAVPVWAVGLFAKSYVPAITAAYVCLTGATFVVLAIVLQYHLTKSRQQSARARRLGAAQSTIAQAFGNLSQAAIHGAADGEGESVRRQGDWAAQRLAEAFSSITVAPCRVTVKQIFRPAGEQRVAVKDLFRSHPAQHRPPEHVDWVDENTDFEEVMAKGAEYWLCDDIIPEFERRYRNSHVTHEQARAGDVPYRSVLVVRIASPGQGADPELAGFICLDSLQPGIFRKNFDVSTVKSLAHALYSILMWYRRAES